MTEKRPHQAATAAAFTDFMTSRRMRKTPERYAIFERIQSMPSHFLIDDLFRQMDEDGYHVSRTTVYNTVNLLVDAGLVRRLQIGNEPARYEQATATTHHHLVCTACGRIREFSDADIDASLSQHSFGTFSAQYSQLTVYGICRLCQRSSRRKSVQGQSKQ